MLSPWDRKELDVIEQLNNNNYYYYYFCIFVVVVFKKIFISFASSLLSAGFPLQWLLLLWSMGSRGTALKHTAWAYASGVFPDQGSNQCPLPWQKESQPLDHQGRSYHYYSYYHPLFGRRPLATEVHPSEQLSLGCCSQHCPLPVQGQSHCVATAQFLRHL